MDSAERARAARLVLWSLSHESQSSLQTPALGCTGGKDAAKEPSSTLSVFLKP